MASGGRGAIQRIAGLIVALIVVAAVVAPMPGHEIFRDNALADTTPAGDWDLAYLLVPLFAFGLLVTLRPDPRAAIAWSTGTWMLSIAWFVATFEPDRETTQVELLWPARVLGFAIAGSYVLLLALVFVSTLVLAAWWSMIRALSWRGSSTRGCSIPTSVEAG